MVVYGFEFVFNMDNLCNMHDFITELYELNMIVKAPFRIHGILSTFDPMMCYSESRDMMTSVVLGFTPDADLAVTAGLIAELKEYAGSDLFKEYTLKDTPGFFCGVEWAMNEEEDEDEEDEEEEEDEEDEEEDEEEEDEEEEDEDEDEEDEEEFDFDEIPMVKQDQLD